MNEALTFSVRGTPRPKARPRFIRGRVVTTTKPKEKLWRLAVERAARQAVAYRGDPAPVFTGPVRTTMIFTIPTDDRTRIGKPHTAKPDKENLEKLVLDAMERAGVYKNDSQVSAGPVEKWWGERGGVVVFAEPMDGARAQAPSSVEPMPDWLKPGR